MEKRFRERSNSAKEAILKAEAATEERFKGVNEFRNTLSDQQRTFIPRSEAELQNSNLNDRLHKLETRITTVEGKGTGISQGSAF